MFLGSYETYECKFCIKCEVVVVKAVGAPLCFNVLRDFEIPEALLDVCVFLCCMDAVACLLHARFS
jgi:hypothetical protein